MYKTCHRKAFCYSLYIVWNNKPSEKWGISVSSKVTDTTDDKQVHFNRTPAMQLFFCLKYHKKSIISDSGKAINVTAIHKCLLDVSASYVVLLATHKRVSANASSKRKIARWMHDRRRMRVNFIFFLTCVTALLFFLCSP